jgi:very-short-patch-repair endonuclease
MEFSLVIALIFIVVIVMAVANARIGRRFGRPTYSKSRFLTQPEAQLYRRLKSALGEGFEVFAQVSMGAVMEPQSRDKQTRRADFNRICAKRIDFIITDNALDIVCIVELDDRSHNIEKDAERDALTASAGIPTIRWMARALPGPKDIRRAIHELAPHVMSEDQMQTNGWQARRIAKAT